MRHDDDDCDDEDDDGDGDEEDYDDDDGDGEEEEKCVSGGSYGTSRWMTMMIFWAMLSTLR